MMNLYLANLGKYNEGILKGAWLELPCTEEEFEETLVKIGVATMIDGEFKMGKIEKDENGYEYIYEEYAIHDWECDINGIEISEYSNIEKLNEIAMVWEEADEYERKCFEALVEAGYTEVEKIEDMKNILDGYCFLELEEMFNMDEALGYALADLNGVTYELEKIGMENYFDYEKYGRDARYDGVYIADNNIAIL